MLESMRFGSRSNLGRKPPKKLELRGYFCGSRPKFEQDPNRTSQEGQGSFQFSLVSRLFFNLSLQIAYKNHTYEVYCWRNNCNSSKVAKNWSRRISSTINYYVISSGHIEVHPRQFQPTASCWLNQKSTSDVWRVSSPIPNFSTFCTVDSTGRGRALSRRN